jgi:Ca2+-binding RTX toxin-like protein
VLGAITSIQGGSGDDVLDAGATVTSLLGEGGDDTLLGGSGPDYLLAGDGDDTIAAGDGDDRISGGAGADVLGGGPGHDEVSYSGERVPLRLSIGDGADDGAAGEGDDIQADVEDLIGGSEADVMVGDDDANRLVAYSGRDTLVGRGGSDRLEGWNDGDQLVAGPGADTVLAGERDLPVLRRWGSGGCGPGAAARPCGSKRAVPPRAQSRARAGSWFIWSVVAGSFVRSVSARSSQAGGSG